MVEANFIEADKDLNKIDFLVLIKIRWKAVG
jgi:hypothetical protein